MDATACASRYRGACGRLGAKPRQELTHGGPLDFDANFRLERSRLHALLRAVPNKHQCEINDLLSGAEALMFSPERSQAAQLLSSLRNVAWAFVRPLKVVQRTCSRSGHYDRGRETGMYHRDRDHLVFACALRLRGNSPQRVK